MVRGSAGQGGYSQIPGPGAKVSKQAPPNPPLFGASSSMGPLCATKSPSEASRAGTGGQEGGAQKPGSTTACSFGALTEEGAAGLN